MAEDRLQRRLAAILSADVVGYSRDGVAAAVHKPETRVRIPTVGESRTIAVLTFVNMSGDPEQEFFADGITEDILTELTRFSRVVRYLPKLRVCLQYVGAAVVDPDQTDIGERARC